jgi:hypothetical protein
VFEGKRFYTIVESGRNLNIEFKGDAHHLPETILTLRTQQVNGRTLYEIESWQKDMTQEDVQRFALMLGRSCAASAGTVNHDPMRFRVLVIDKLYKFLDLFKGRSLSPGRGEPPMGKTSLLIKVQVRGIIHHRNDGIDPNFCEGRNLLWCGLSHTAQPIGNNPPEAFSQRGFTHG